jgi:predicted nucleotide-binding protein
MVYHAIIQIKKEKAPFSFWFNLQRKDVQKFSNSYNKGKDFFFSDRVIKADSVRSIYIFYSNKDFNRIKLPNGKTVREEENGTYIIDSLSSGIYNNVVLCTEKFIDPISKDEIAEVNENKNTLSKANVFIVHGTDHQPVSELKSILKEFNIIPIILNEQPSKGLTIIEKLEEYGNVGFSFVILTPDDIGVKRQVISECYGAYNFGEDANNPEIIKWVKGLSRPIAEVLLDRIQPSIQNRARQNVILEFGYFIGKLGRNKVCCLYNGDLELPSDMQGICYARFNNSINEVKELIIEELRVANIIKH